MNEKEIFELYRKERITYSINGFKKETFDEFVRYTPLENEMDGIIMFNNFSAENIETIINEQINYFKNLKFGFEWKVYDFDEPDNLAEALLAKGFKAEDKEAFMVYPLNNEVKIDDNENFIVKKINDAAGIKDILVVQEKVWNKNFDWLYDQLAASLDGSGNKQSLYCAYNNDGIPVASGWIEYPEASSFAELHGGSVLNEYRGTGIYSALFNIRVNEAINNGYKFLSVDASPDSKPILLKKGFRFICNTTPYKILL